MHCIFHKSIASFFVGILPMGLILFFVAPAKIPSLL